MADPIDYYFTLNSPWSYLGHERLRAAAARHGVPVIAHPVDFGVIFPATGGLPLPRRAPARQAYRLVELARWRDHLGVALHIQPAHWPADEALGASMVLALREQDGDAVDLAGRLLRAVWAEERDIADPGTLAALAGEAGLDGAALLEAARSEAWAGVRESESREAIERGVFGAPTYLYRGEPFWGQDRVEFLERALA